MGGRGMPGRIAGPGTGTGTTGTTTRTREGTGTGGIGGVIRIRRVPVTAFPEIRPCVVMLMPGAFTVTRRL